MSERVAIRSIKSVFLKDIIREAVIIEKSKSRDGKIVYIEGKNINDTTLLGITFVSKEIEKYIDDYLFENFVLIQNRGVYIKKNIIPIIDRKEFNHFGFFSLYHKINETYEIRFLILTHVYLDKSFIKFLVEYDLLDKKLLKELSNFYLKNLQGLEFKEDIFYFLNSYLKSKKNKETLYLYMDIE